MVKTKGVVFIDAVLEAEVTSEDGLWIDTLWFDRFAKEVELI